MASKPVVHADYYSKRPAGHTRPKERGKQDLDGIQNVSLGVPTTMPGVYD
jgi:hypothetical protein